MDENKSDKNKELDKDKEEACPAKTITPAEAYTMIRYKKEHDMVIIDVRAPEELQSGRIDNAINLNFSSESFRTDLEKLDKKRKYIVYCRKGIRSCKAVEIMRHIGFSDVQSIEGGIESWEKEGFPLESAASKTTSKNMQ